MEFLCILYCYFRYTGRPFPGCALFVARCNIIRVLWLHALLSRSFVAFFVYSLLPKWRTFSIAPIRMHIFLLVVFCVMISWVNGQKHENLQSWPKYFRQTVVFLWNSTLRKGSISIFQEFFASIDKILILGAGLTTRL